MPVNGIMPLGFRAPDILLHASCSHEAEKRGEGNGVRVIGTIELFLVLELVDGGHWSTRGRARSLKLEEAVEALLTEAGENLNGCYYLIMCEWVYQSRAMLLSESCRILYPLAPTDPRTSLGCCPTIRGAKAILGWGGG